MESPKGQDWIWIALGLGALYVVYTVTQGAKKVATDLYNLPGNVLQSLANAGADLSQGLFDWLNPNVGGPTISYMVNFADGTRAAIGNDQLDQTGHFTYGGTSYVLKDDSAGKHWAVPV